MGLRNRSMGRIKRSWLIVLTVVFFVLAACNPENNSQRADKRSTKSPGISETEILLGTSPREETTTPELFSKSP